ncbi:MAG: molybdenum cofactor carrier protein [Acidobacteria bacterium]|nr:molybdenum cofactor carrier protein [Acidobacteriota bacterium]
MSFTKIELPVAARRPVIGVMGSGVDPHPNLACPLGVWIAEAGYHLLTGGGAGVMAAVSGAFAAVKDRRGLVLGILPSVEGTPGRESPDGYPNRWVELPIRTHLASRGSRGDDPASRNHINVLTADVVVVLPGGAGTASEVQLAARYGRPCVAFVLEPDRAPGLPPSVPVVTSVDAVADYVRAHL